MKAHFKTKQGELQRPDYFRICFDTGDLTTIEQFGDGTFNIIYNPKEYRMDFDQCIYVDADEFNQVLTEKLGVL